MPFTNCPNHALKLMLASLTTRMDSILSQLHSSVDQRQLWDGSFDESLIHNSYDDDGILWRSQIYIPLTYGGLRFIAQTSTYGQYKGELSGFTCRYVLGDFRDYGGKLLNTNSITRAAYSLNSTPALESETKFLKEFNKKFKSLMAGIASWYKDSHLRTIDNTWLDSNTVYAAVARLRLAAELYSNRTEVDDNVKRYMQSLADEAREMLVRLNRESLRTNLAPVTEHC